MSAVGNKPFSFVSGILLGVLATIGLLFLLMNDFNPFNMMNENGTSSTNDTLVDLRLNKPTGNKKSKKSNSVIQKEEPLILADSFTIMNDTQTANFSPNEEDIIVRRDELLESRVLELVLLDGKPKSNKTDSLLKLIDNSGSEKTQHKIEYWKSPVNYRGFKMIRTNIIVFGLETGENSRLYSYEQELYLKHGSSVYKIYQTSVFQPFVRINEESIIKLMR